MSRKRLGSNPLTFIRSTVDEEDEVSKAPASARPEPLAPPVALLAPPVPDAQSGNSVADEDFVKFVGPGAGVGSEIRKPTVPLSAVRAEAIILPDEATLSPAQPVPALHAPIETPVQKFPVDELQPLDPMAVEFPVPAPEEVPKYLTFEEKISVLFRADQVAYLTQVERVIMHNRSRSNKKERITKNTILRAMVDFFMDHRFDYREVADEALLLERFKAGCQRGN